ncbi:MAG: transposase [Cyanobacteria bacterium P01_D01_bin.116]
MRISYQYRLKPNKEQKEKIDNTLEMLRYQYNYQLAQRFNWYETHRCSIDRCSLVCHLPELSEKPNRFSQQASLKQLKKERPWYKNIHSQVLQQVPKKVEIAFDRWLKGDCNGKKSGRPRFKGAGRYRTFTYSQFKQHNFTGSRITLSKIGDVKVICHRPLPDGFVIKTVSATKKADGYYVTLSLQDESVPTVKPDFDVANIVGIDVGLKFFLISSNKDKVKIPQFYRKSESKLKWANRKLSRAKKGSNRWKKLKNQLSKKHKKVADTKKDFHHKTACNLLSRYDVVAVEKLNVKELARTKLAKSIHDAGWSSFIDILSNKAVSGARR